MTLIHVIISLDAFFKYFVMHGSDTNFSKISARKLSQITIKYFWKFCSCNKTLATFQVLTFFISSCNNNQIHQQKLTKEGRTIIIRMKFVIKYFLDV